MADTRERVLSVARDLVHRSTFADVSVDAVCKAAGVNKGSLYHFFSSKRALGLAVLDRNWEMMRGVLDATLDTEQPPLERLDAFISAYIERMGAAREAFGAVPGCPVGNLAAELSAADGELRARAREVLEAWTARLAAVIHEAQARGDADAGLDATAAARSVVAAIQGYSVLAKAEDDVAALEPLRGLTRRLVAAV